jgi:prepilin-type N-terminal cleavage/methylation domain-containing protein
MNKLHHPGLPKARWRRLPCDLSHPPHPVLPCARTAFTLTELLVAVAIILVLMSLIGGAVSAARGSLKKQTTQPLIGKLNAIIQQQYASYSTRPVVSATSSSQRAAALRQMASGDMPDSWKEVITLRSGTATLVSSSTAPFPLNAAQRAYISYYNTLSPTDTFADAECLFMIVMIGGIADCLDCGGLALAEKGDKDGDNAPEFLDAWGNPIRYVLWPAGLELPSGSGTKFFSSTAPFTSGSISPAPGGPMRPLIFSFGPDGRGSTVVNDGSNIAMNLDCGNPANASVAILGGLPASDPDSRADNITNFDDEIKP